MPSFFADFNLADVVVQYFCLLFSLCFHEAAHAWMAYRCGDDTAKQLGRITMNPAKHIDPIGTVVMPLVMAVTNVPYLVGWAKPVPFIPRRLNDMQRDPVLIAIAGPLSNLLLAVIFTIALKLFLTTSIFVPLPDHVFETVFNIGGSMITVNLCLFLFNFIPVPPLDGHWVLSYFLPPRGQEMLHTIGPAGIIIAILVGGWWVNFAIQPFVYALSWFLWLGLPQG